MYFNFYIISSIITIIIIISILIATAATTTTTAITTTTSDDSLNTHDNRRNVKDGCVSVVHKNDSGGMNTSISGSKKGNKEYFSFWEVALWFKIAKQMQMHITPHTTTPWTASHWSHLLIHSESELIMSIQNIQNVTFAQLGALRFLMEGILEPKELRVLLTKLCFNEQLSEDLIAQLIQTTDISL